jgi:hypothetical protein
MKCAFCDRLIVENNLDAVPIEPKGSIDRQWACTECISKQPKIVQAILKRFSNQKIGGTCDEVKTSSKETSN